MKPKKRPGPSLGGRSPGQREFEDILNKYFFREYIKELRQRQLKDWLIERNAGRKFQEEDSLSHRLAEIMLQGPGGKWWVSI